MTLLKSIKQTIRFVTRIKRCSMKYYTPRYKLLNVYKDENDKYMATFQFINKGHTFHAKPDEILSDDNFVNFLSPLDVRTLTYLGYLEMNQPEYKLLAKRLSEDNSEVFIIKKRGEKSVITKTAEEINYSTDIISKMGAEDAKTIGYAIASMEVLEEKRGKAEALNELTYSNPLKSMHKLVIGTTGDYPPFSFLNDTNSFEGFDIELMIKIASSCNFSVEFVKTTWYDLHNDLKAEKFDMAIGGISLTDDRTHNFLTSTPIIVDGKSILMSKSHLNKIKSLEDADNGKYTIIVNRGGTNEKFVKEHIKKARIIIVDDNLSIFEDLATGVADIMITDLSEALYRQSLDERLTVINPETIYTNPIGYGYLFNKKNIELKTLINNSLEKFIKMPEFNDLYYKYFKRIKNV